MKLQQLSLFLENRPGQIKLPCQALGKAGIDILTLSLADTQQFGILRLIVKEPDEARKVLEAAGCVVKVNEVLAIEVQDPQEHEIKKEGDPLYFRFSVDRPVVIVP